MNTSDGASASQTQAAEWLLPPAPLLLDLAHDAFIVRDLEDRICSWSKGAERLYGWRADEVVGQNFYELLFPPQMQDFEKQRISLVQTGEWAGEMCQNTRSGAHIYVESRWKLQRDTLSAAQYVVIANRDITEKKMLERQILRTQRVESVAVIASAITHDLSNVLPAMLNLMRELQTEDMDPRRLADIESLQFQGEQAARLMAELLSLTNESVEKLAEVDLVHLIREVEKFFNAGFRNAIQITTVVPEGLRTVTGNITHLYQVFLNLCLNARDAMPSGGALTIDAANVELDQFDAAQWPEARSGGYVRIKVSDTGCGISDAISDRIFEPLFTTKELGKGSGLGLFSVARIVKNHEGFLNFSSDPGRGAEFSIYLPSGERG